MFRLSTEVQGSMETRMLMDRFARKPTSTQQSMLVQLGRILQEMEWDTGAGVEAKGHSDDREMLNVSKFKIVQLANPRKCCYIRKSIAIDHKYISINLDLFGR